MNYFNLQGKTALITGASSGLGKQFAICLANAGARVILSARRSEPLKFLSGQNQTKHLDDNGCLR